MKKKLLILNLEDSEKDAELIEEQLSGEGFDCSVVRVENEKDYIQALERKKFDLILADYSLPDFDGISALKIAREKRPDIPFIFISGAIGEELAIEMLKNGAVDYVLKNRMSRLAPAVSRALQMARERKERKQAEEALKSYREHLEQLVKERSAELAASEERFQLAMRGASDGLWDWNVNTDEVYYSPRWKSMLGYADDELENKLDTCKALMHPDDLPPCLEYVEKFLKSGSDRFEKEFRLRHKDGSYRIILSRAFLARGDQNRPLRLVGTHVDITELKQAEEKVRASLAEKEILLKEIYHRTKNNMQVISGLLNLQSMSCGDGGLQQAFKETQDRIRAMSLVHERLYKSKDLSNLDIKAYIEDLCSAIMESYPQKAAKISIKLEVESIPMSIELATPCGLIINELLSNSLKHAFPADGTGEIRIAVHQGKNDEITIIYSDSGAGLPDGLDIGKTKTLGLRLVHNLVSVQLKGKLEVSRKNGAEFKITFDPNFSLSHTP